MAFDLEEINYKTIRDPKGFVEECDAEYAAKISLAADKIIENMAHSPVVLLSGPSGSGKTTSAQKIEEELEKRGVGSHTVSMDNYFNTVDPETSPKNEDGSYDFESPHCLDLCLFNRQIDLIEKGQRVAIPKYDFSTQSRDTGPSKILKLKKDEIVIFEGIHALNDMIVFKHPNAFKLYISARSDTFFGDRRIFKGTWLRLMRRTVRDHLFRSYDPDKTIAMWANVRRGEKLHISPFKNRANLQLDTALKYEAPVMNETATKLFADIPEGIDRYEELRQLLPALQLFGVISEELVAPDSLIREFIGGGIYSQ